MNGMKAASLAFVVVGGLSAIVFAVLLTQGLMGSGANADERWHNLLPWLIMSGVFTFVGLLLALIFGVVSAAGGRGVATEGAGGAATNQAMQALLATAGPSLRITQASAGTARVEVASVGSEHGRAFIPLTYNLQMEVLVHFDEASRRYSYTSTWFESTGFSRNSEKFRGVMQRAERGKYLTLDGVVTVDFNTNHIYAVIDQALAPLGWSR